MFPIPYIRLHYNFNRETNEQTCDFDLETFTQTQQSGLQ